jgi:hypothetical protein
LRVVWIVTVVVWLTMSLFYWPFWLAQADKRLVTTYLNCGRFLLLNPVTSIVLALVDALLIGVSLVSALPIVAGLICWLALIGVVAVRQGIARK